MLLFPQILLFAITAFQDFKSRAISWFLLPIILAAGLLKKWIDNQLSWTDYLASFGFITLQLAIVYGIFALKSRTVKINFTNELLGLGDILFFVAVIPYFNFKEYIILFITGLIFSLLGQLILCKFKKQKSIPLAGWLSIYFIFYLVLVQF